MLSGAAPPIKGASIKPIECKEAKEANVFPPLAPSGWPLWDLGHQARIWREKFPNKVTSLGSALVDLQKQYPYFVLPGHYLHKRVQDCLQLLNSNDEGGASTLISHLQHEVQQEERTVQAVYSLFTLSLHDRYDPFYKRESMRQQDVYFLLDYFGFPSSKADMDTYMRANDTNRDSLVSVAEFAVFVGRMGGSLELFEIRKSAEQRNRFALLAADESTTDVEELTNKVLQASGIDAPKQTFWRAVLPYSELHSVAALKPCQQAALTKIRELAEYNHRKSLGPLQDRFKKLGFTGREMEITLAWIREVPPIIIQVDLNTISSFFNNDTHYRNQFETGTSGGLLSIEGRRKWETDLFKGAYDGKDVEDFDRCKYGCINIMNDSKGVARTEIYGESYLVLKNVRLRCTFSPRDSGNLTADRLAVIDYFAHQLVEYSDAELLEVSRIANSSQNLVGNSTMIRFLQYKEAQIHGEVVFAKDVERLVADDKHNSGSFWPQYLKDTCAKHGWKFSWVSEEKARIETEEAMKQVSADTWKERLEVQPTQEEIASRRRKTLQKNTAEKSTAKEKKGAEIDSAKKAVDDVVKSQSQQAIKDSRSERAQAKAAKEKADADKKAARAKAEAAAKAAKDKGNKAIREANGDLELAWVLLISQEEADAAALVARLQAVRESRAGDLRNLGLSVLAMATTTAQKAWAKVKDEMSVQTKIWDSQAAIGLRSNYGRLKKEMRGLLEMAEVDPEGAALMIDDVISHAYSSNLNLGSGLVEAVNATRMSQQLSQNRFELAARLEGLVESSDKLSGSEERELKQLIQACQLGNRRLETRTEQLLTTHPRLGD